MAGPKLLTRLFQVRVKPQDLAFWKAVAAREGISVAELLRRAANGYASRRLRDESEKDA